MNRFLNFSLIVLGIMFICSSFLFELEEEEKLWQENVKLSWDDYKGVPDTLSTNVAKTYSTIEFIYLAQNGIVNFDFACYFNMSKSWVKYKSNELLSHEQLHFDIAELVARKIRKETSELKTDSYNLDEILLAVDEIYNKNYDIVWDSIVNLYDAETKHGTITSNQTIWKNKINLELKKLSSFSMVNVFKTIKK